MPQSAPAPNKPGLLVLTSTYPRWKGDHEPGFVHELARRLTGRFNVHVLAPHALGAEQRESLDGVDVWRYRYAPSRLETLVNDGGIVNNLKSQRWKWLLVPGFLLALIYATWRIIRQVRPDIIHAHWLIPQGLVVAMLSKASRTPPFVVTSHGADLFALRARPLKAIKRFVARHATALTVVSPAMVEDLVRLEVDVDKISVMPMGVDLKNHFTSDESVKRSQYEILFVGRLVEKKGLRYLIDAMPEILKHHPEAHLTIAGYGPEEDRVRRQASDLDLGSRVEFLGAVPQEQLPTLYRRAALFVAPFIEATSGDQEGLGLVTVEAIGCGCPAIISDLPATRTLPTQKVPPASSQELAEEIVKFLHHDGNYRSTEAKKQRNQIEGFDWQAVAENYALTFENNVAEN